MLLPNLPERVQNPEPRQVRFLSLDAIQPAPENEELYRPVTADDPAIIELAESIRRRGVEQPLIISSDHFIISGHRRYVAAQMAGLTEVPCEVANISRGAARDCFLKALREHNRQRVKDFGELMREAVIDVNPHNAYTELQAGRRERSRDAVYCTYPIYMRARKSRFEISRAKHPMLEAILQVLDDLHAYLPLGERSIHYNLLNDPPLRHASKPASVYRNDKPSSSDLSDLVTRARLDGTIPFEAICDETRPETDWPLHRSPESYIKKQLDGLFTTYWRDLLQSQPNHIELIVEKNTVFNILKPLAAEYCLHEMSGRGYSSIPPRWKIAQSYKNSGREKLVLILVGDFDPDGEMIAESFARSMRDDFDLDTLCVRPIKAALTLEQINHLNLVSSLEPKKESKNIKNFIAEYGPDQMAYELEAIPPATLIALVREAIDSVLDHEAFENEQEQERQDAANLAPGAWPRLNC